MMFDFLVSKLIPADKEPPFQMTNNESSASVRQNTSLYVFGVLLSQGKWFVAFIRGKQRVMVTSEGGPCPWWALSIRLIAAAWCLTAFILVNGYCSTLITYVISHNNPPLIESVHDLVRDPTINLVVEKGKAFELMFTVLIQHQPGLIDLLKRNVSM